MGMFRRNREDGEGFSGISGVKKPKDQEKKVVKINFPTAGLEPDQDYFDDEDKELANRLRQATPEELVGTATLYLAKAEVGGDLEDSAAAIAYLMFAQARANEPQSTLAQQD